MAADLAFLIAPASAADGDLLNTVTTSFSATTTVLEVANAVAIQPDGKIVAAGRSDSDLAAAKYDDSATLPLNSAFGVGGKRTDPVTQPAQGMALQADGKIVTIGGAAGAFRLARYNSDGSLDDGGPSDSTAGDSFGITNGRVVTGVGSDGVGRAVAIQSDGKIVAAGYADVEPTSPSSRFEFVLARYLPNGTLDPSFGTGGLVTTSQVVPPLSYADYHGNQMAPNEPAHNYAHAVAIQPSGRIVVAGTTLRYYVTSPDDNVPGLPPNPSQFDNDFVLVGYTPAGQLDTSFGTTDTTDPDTKALTGKTVTSMVPGQNDVANAVALHADGRIVVAGQTSSATVAGDFAVARYSRDGDLETISGVEQKKVFDIGGVSTSDGANGVAVQADGKVVMAGNGGTGCTVARTTAPSLVTLDSTFSSPDGIATQATCRYNAAALQANGDIVAVGTTGAGTDFRVDRYDSTTSTPSGLSVGDVTITEGNEVSRVDFTVTAPPSAQARTVNYSTEAATAAAESDYVSVSGTLEFPASPSTQTRPVTVVINGDRIVEGDEYFFVNLFWPTGGTIGDGEGKGTIGASDAPSPPRTLSIADLSFTEGEPTQAPVATRAQFTITLSPTGPSSEPVAVQYTTVYGNGEVPGTATSSDFVGTNSGTVVLDPGVAATHVVTILVNADNSNENNETFHVFLSDPVGAGIVDGVAVGTILDDD